jgi:hypothetical protein
MLVGFAMFLANALTLYLSKEGIHFFVMQCS